MLVSMVTAILVEWDCIGVTIATGDEPYTKQDQLKDYTILNGMNHSL